MSLFLSRKPRRRQSGFTLTELAIVLVIVALLIGGMMVPGFRTARHSERDGNKENDVADSGGASWFRRNQRATSVPDADTDPAAAGYGLEEATCSADLASEGYRCHGKHSVSAKPTLEVQNAHYPRTLAMATGATVWTGISPKQSPLPHRFPVTA